MRIGLFTDTYLPSINGIVYVVKSLKENLEAAGHEVFIFCPASSMRPNKQKSIYQEGEHIIRFPSVKGAFYDDYDTSFLFPPRVLKMVKDLDLDIIQVFTPGQIGLMGMQAAWWTKKPFVIQHSTDIYEFVEHYPEVLPGALALVGLVVPFTVKLGGKDVKELVKLYRPRRGATKWNQDIIEKVVTIVYSKANAVIVLSRKSRDQLASWQKDDRYKYPLTLIPSGVPPIPKATNRELLEFRKTWQIDARDEVFGFIGRLAEEKNLPLLISSLEIIIKKRPRARLLFIGDFEYRETLESIAAESPVADRITFTGSIPRLSLGAALAVMKVFVFPSLKDTQGWVLHEAAHAGLPIVLVDPKVSEVVIDGKNGYLAENNAEDFASKVEYLLAHPKLRQEFGAKSVKLAQKFTEKKQVKKLIDLYVTLVEEK